MVTYDNAVAAVTNNSITYGLGSATRTCASTGLFNLALDNTVVTHEFGHLLTYSQMKDNTDDLFYPLHEGLADFWSASINFTPTMGAWCAQNRGTVVQDGGVPRQADPLDVFPEHRAFSTDPHADGQILCWALWSAATGMLRAWAAYEDYWQPGFSEMQINLLSALTTTGTSVQPGYTDKNVYDSFYDLYEQLLTRFMGSPFVNKLIAGFARAGFLLSEKDAVIDINSDYLSRIGNSAPRFVVWTGRDYRFNGEQAYSANVYNSQFQIEVANEPTFINSVKSPTLGGVTVSAEGVPTATWTLPWSDWISLKGGDFLYYRVRTWSMIQGHKTNQRISTSPGNGIVGEVSAPRAIIFTPILPGP